MSSLGAWHAIDNDFHEGLLQCDFNCRTAIEEMRQPAQQTPQVHFAGASKAPHTHTGAGSSAPGHWKDMVCSIAKCFGPADPSFVRTSRNTASSEPRRPLLAQRMSAAHHEVAGRPHGDVIWIFGFGSLIYNPNFPFAERIEGYVKGWRRVFYQGSTDHRGTPDAPGRTVTLIEDRDSITWGAAYRLSGTPEEQQKTLKYLEWREKQYDLRYRSDVFGKESNGQPLVEGALVYIATPDRRKNVNWLGEAPLEDLARQIAHAHGPSGPNSEYLFRLAETTRKMGVDDPELFQLEAAVRAICEFGDVPL